MAKDRDIKLSVVIPTYNRSKLVRRAVASVLAELPVGEGEVIVADDGSTDSTVQDLSEQFAMELSQQRLVVVQPPRRGDQGAMRNAGARAARGHHLGFLDNDDEWLPGYWNQIRPHLEKSDVIRSRAIGKRTSPLADCISISSAPTSGSVVSRRLFLEVRGFPEGYFGPFRKFWPGFEDYEFWLRCLARLENTGRAGRFTAVPELKVRIERQPGGQGEMPLRMQMSREAASLLRVVSKIPPRYWPLWSRRMLGAAKAIVLG